jgi:hypothetical protein
VIAALPLTLLSVLAFQPAAPAPPPAAPAPPPAPAPPAPEATAAPEPPPNGVGFGAGVGHRFPPSSEDVPPSYGLAFSVAISRRYALLGERLALGGAVSFGYERYARTVPTALAPGQDVTIRGLTFGDFVLLQTVTAVWGRARPFLAVGGGISLQHFTSREAALKPGEARANVPVAQAAAGVAVEVKPNTDVVLRIDYVRPFPERSLTTDSGERLRIFGTRLAARVGIQYRF